MDAGDEAAEPLERFGVVQFRRAPAAARIQGETKSLKSMQRSRVHCYRRHRRNLAFRELRGEDVFLENLRIAPARRPVEFRDQRLVVLNADLINPVFIAVQRQQPAVAAKSDGFDRIQHQIGRQPGIRWGGFGHAPKIRENLSDEAAGSARIRERCGVPSRSEVTRAAAFATVAAGAEGACSTRFKLKSIICKVLLPAVLALWSAAASA